MTKSTVFRVLPILAAFGLCAGAARADDQNRLDVLRGLAPVTALNNDAAGRAALKANLANTGAIQLGVAHQPMPLPFSDQQRQAMRDAFIAANATVLADGLGSTLGGVFQKMAPCTSKDDGATPDCTPLPPATAKVVATANDIARADAGAGKYFFANATTNGTDPVSHEAAEILADVGGVTDIFGKAYGVPAGPEGGDGQDKDCVLPVVDAKRGDKFGDPRPFQTEPEVLTFKGNDFFDVPTNNLAYLYGPTQNLTGSPSYPSGHTTYGYTEGMMLALLVPERYPQMVARAAEYGNDRIVMGAHYAMDVLGGRTLALYDLAHLLSNDDFRQSLVEARDELTKTLEAGCKETLKACAAHDTGRLGGLGRDGVFYESTQTYGLPVVHAKTAKGVEDVAKLAPEAGYLITAAFPYLTLPQADAILTSTEGKGGGFLDDGSAFGVYSRLDLFRAGLWAEALTPKVAKSKAH
jgi:hypothetical protein